MSDGRPDEIAHGPQDTPPRLRRLRLDRLPRWSAAPPWLRALAAFAALILVLLAVLQQRHQQGPVAHPTATPTDTQTGSAQTGSASFGVTSTCQPKLGSNHSLTLRFTLTNITSGPVVVREIRASLPLGGLETVSVDIAGGTCEAHGAAPAGLEVASGGSLLVSFRFLLPDSCPAPYPVGAQILVRSPAGVDRSESDLVYSDLGGIKFSNCP